LGGLDLALNVCSRQEDVQMMRSPAIGVGLAAVTALASLTSVAIAGAQAPSATKTATKRWAPPRTPWGDPDLQGNFTNKYEQATPLERPEELDGRRIEDIRGQELTAILTKRQQAAIERAPFQVGDPEGRIATPEPFRDANELRKGSRPWMIIDPPDGRIPPLTPEARLRPSPEARAGSSFGNGPFNGPEDLGLHDRCISRGFPGSMLPFAYGNSYQILQAPDWIAIRYEMVHETRIIPLDGRPHGSPSLRSFMGDARGHWEGNTLVVDTTNLSERGIYRNANPKTLRIIERFTRTGPDKVDWAVTIDDPSTWTKPWTFSLPLTLNDNEPVYEYACHEGNYGLRNILSAARTAEKAD
jgi:hypothetical protein